MSGGFTCTAFILPRRITVSEPRRFPAVSLLSTSSNILWMCTHGPTGGVYTCTHCCSTGFGLELEKKRGIPMGAHTVQRDFSYPPYPTVLKWHLQPAVSRWYRWTIMPGIRVWSMTTCQVWLRGNQGFQFHQQLFSVRNWDEQLCFKKSVLITGKVSEAECPLLRSWKQTRKMDGWPRQIKAFRNLAEENLHCIHTDD